MQCLEKHEQNCSHFILKDPVGRENCGGVGVGEVNVFTSGDIDHETYTTI